MSESSLVTFPPSLDCELARFLLGQYRVPYGEDRHTLIFSFAVTLWKAQTLHFPLLSGAGRPPLDSVRKMIDGLDPLAPSELQLLPTFGTKERDAVEADWPRFNATLGGAVAVFSYFHLLPHRAIMLRPLSEGTPWFERLTVRLAYPVFKGLLTYLLKLSPANVETALTQIRSVVAGVDARLADGRPYLVGDRFTLSDMAFANALGPLVLPPRYGGPLPTYGEMPLILQQTIAEMRARPAGRFAMRIYAEHRRSSALKPR
ncbi:glutathione S-transferase C-terminal domain-containing protein [Methylorubrum sp. SB2]|uniref:glutathione S-transferase C-terminal domain-containing protein n=1 Tax=Methylorubrum subtropicum TaxID=3138812 RepID=UPI00313D8C4D